MDNPLLRDLTNQIPFFHDIPPNPAYFQLSRRADVEKGIFFFLFSFFFFLTREQWLLNINVLIYRAIGRVRQILNNNIFSWLTKINCLPFENAYYDTASKSRIFFTRSWRRTSYEPHLYKQPNRTIKVSKNIYIYNIYITFTSLFPFVANVRK